MLKKKHSELFEVLQSIYRQDVMAINEDVKLRKKSPCPCGSQKSYKRCCMPSNLKIKGRESSWN